MEGHPKVDPPGSKALGTVAMSLLLLLLAVNVAVTSYMAVRSRHHVQRQQDVADLEVRVAHLEEQVVLLSLPMMQTADFAEWSRKRFKREASALPEPEPEPVAAPEPEPEPEAAAAPVPGPEPEADPEAASDPEPDPEAEVAVPIVETSYVGNEDLNTEGLRIYDAFFQHRQNHQIPQDPTLPVPRVNLRQGGGGGRRRRVEAREDFDGSGTILRHHRTSAAWVERGNGGGQSQVVSSSRRTSSSSISGNSMGSSLGGSSSSSSGYGTRVSSSSGWSTSARAFRGSYTRPSGRSSSFSSQIVTQQGRSQQQQQQQQEEEEDELRRLQQEELRRRQRLEQQRMEQQQRLERQQRLEQQRLEQQRLEQDQQEEQQRQQQLLEERRQQQQQQESMEARAARNRASVRSGDRHHNNQQLRTSVSSSSSSSLSRMGFRGLSAVHYVAEDSGSSDANGNSVSNSADGVFRRWSPARWARRTGAEGGAFSLDAAQGTVAVGEAGIYLVYVQDGIHCSLTRFLFVINYLNDHDVNSYMVEADGSPFLSCTTMTYTRQAATKANTCFTSGVRYLESGSVLGVRDLEPRRASVMLPAHSYFGLVQLASRSAGEFP